MVTLWGHQMIASLRKVMKTKMLMILRLIHVLSHRVQVLICMEMSISLCRCRQVRGLEGYHQVELITSWTGWIVRSFRLFSRRKIVHISIIRYLRDLINNSTKFRSTQQNKVLTKTTTVVTLNTLTNQMKEKVPLADKTLAEFTTNQGHRIGRRFLLNSFFSFSRNRSRRSNRILEK